MKKIKLRRQFRRQNSLSPTQNYRSHMDTQKLRPKKEQKRKITYGLLLKQNVGSLFNPYLSPSNCFKEEKKIWVFSPSPIIQHITGAVVESLIKYSPIMGHNVHCPWRPKTFIRDFQIQSFYFGLPIKNLHSILTEEFAMPLLSSFFTCQEIYRIERDNRIYKLARLQPTRYRQNKLWMLS